MPDFDGQLNEAEVASSLRERTQAEISVQKQKAEANEKKNAPSSLKPNPSATALRWAWGLFIPSFGLSLIWINIHCFFYVVIRDEKIVCKLGDEWKLPGDFNRYGNMANAVEPWAVLMLNFVIFISGITLATFVNIVIYGYTHPFETLKMVIGGIYAALFN